MKSARLRTLALAFLAVTLVMTVQAQLRLDVRMVEVVATVTDDKGRYIPNLTKEDFIVREDGDMQEIAHAAQSSDLPVSMGILLDASDSMQPKMSTAKAAVERFIKMRRPDDDLFLLAFASSSVIVQDFTSDQKKLTRALDRIGLSFGTALFDAVDDGLLHLRRGTNKKRVLLVITDGQDSGNSSGSHDLFDEALLNARQENVLIYCLGISPDSLPPVQENPRLPTVRRLVPPQLGGGRGGRGGIGGLGGLGGQQGGFGQGRGGGYNTVDMAPLRAFADASGGRAWQVGPDRANLDRILEIINDELRSQYSLGYYLSRPSGVEKWHKIEVQMKNKAQKVQARATYYGK